MSYSSTVLADSPIRYYRLDDGTKTNGSSVVDLGSQTQNGTVVGSGLSAASSLLTSDSDGATTFGSSSYITLPTTGLPTGASNWSIEAWVNMPTLPAGFATIVHIGTASGNDISLQLYYRGGQFRFQTWGWNTFINQTPATITAGVTYHLVVSYDGTNVLLYMNNVLQSTDAQTMNLSYGSAQIGNDTAGDYMAGVIDEVAIYTTTLNSTRIAAHYAAGIAAAAAHLRISDGYGGVFS